ncbi:MAG: DUF1836 domain-containing protein [Oscillospiraceae bacterium]
MDNTEKFSELLAQLSFPHYDGFPDIELYMDQVLDFLSRSRTTLRDDDRLSSAMVNNYIKAEILPRAKGKKYSREHLVHLAVILRLKQVLSVRDTGALIKIAKREKTDKEFYDGFLEMIENSAMEICKKVLCSEDELADTAMRLAVESYLSKICCEYIIDSIAEREPEKLDSPPPPGKQKS